MQSKFLGKPNRRNLMLGSVALSFSSILPLSSKASLNTQHDIKSRALKFLSGLTEDQKTAAMAGFESPRRLNWNFMGPAAKPGLRLEQISEDQKLQVMDMLSAVLSPEGMAKAEKVMILQDVLREMGDGPSDRNRERYSIIFFGEPSDSKLWTWRFEGHHLTLSFTLKGNEVVSVTPSSFSSNPNSVDFGLHKGLVALDKEEILARKVYADLSPIAQTRALIQEKAFGNIITTARRQNRIGNERKGVAFSDIHPAQRDLLVRLIEVYATDHLRSDLAEWQRKRILSGDLMSAHFGWAGSNKANEMMYYRLHGDTFLI